IDRRRLRREADALRAEHSARIAALASDPATSRYADMISGGEYWSDAQIAYDLDTGGAATCVHLQPLERAMRTAGLKVKLLGEGRVEARCRIDASRLEPGPFVRYAEFYLGGRSAEDDPMAQLQCVEHASAIDTLHPDVGDAGAPVFPPRD
ncbi:MAG TPA: hypothetical protein VIO94_03425, partial [Phenylobacterium sp.]